jgi:hypothetical protein
MSQPTYGTININGTNYTLYGRPGSTLRDELNRLANGGTYPTVDNYVDEQLAANIWADGRKEPAVGYLAMEYCLNLKYDNTRHRTDFKDFNGVCNELANIGSPTNNASWVEGLTALRTIAS